MILHHSGYIGGAGVSLIHILESLKRLGHDLEVICPNTPNHMEKKIRGMGIKVKTIDYIPIIEHYSGLERNFLNLRNIKNLHTLREAQEKLGGYLLSYDSDIIMLNSMTLSYLGETLSKSNKKLICFHRETYAKGFLGIRSRWIKKNLRKYFDKVVFISEFDMRQTKGIQEKGKVIFDKVDLNLFTHKSERKEKPLTILYVGGISKLKGIDILLNALAKLDFDYKLIFLQYNLSYKRKKKLDDCKTTFEKLKFILGFDYTKKVLKIIDTHDLWNNIEFVGAQHSVEKFYNKSDVVVFPSTSPHQARPIYEAGAAQLPIVITESENINEFIIHMKNGLTFNNRDFKKLAKSLNLLNYKLELKNTLGLKNYEQTITNHDLKNLDHELYDLLKNI